MIKKMGEKTLNTCTLKRPRAWPTILGSNGPYFCNPLTALTGTGTRTWTGVRTGVWSRKDMDIYTKGDEDRDIVREGKGTWTGTGERTGA
jgi:hypothetical protein